MFNKITSWITGAFVVAGAALAAPASDTQTIQERAAEADFTVQLVMLCFNANFIGCVTVPVVSDLCVNLAGGLAGWNNDVSSINIPLGFVCTFYDNFNCLPSGTPDNGDSVTLQGGSYSSLVSIPDDNGANVNFDNRVSSFLCSPLTY
ncbi:hypothetical protein NP233_g12815 [Leucocoprinus birnbaumii]|uniref:Uncharacterized protein n=1 Tax=Leucocoprinus birnbaumii TaxID=56174 RepID=A0AAD5VFS1_9AGAR|nr:hypothetical protein NP233_g12815 [Leucocoprinus birnbaumii]